MNGLFDLNTSEAASTSTSFEENSFERAYQILGVLMDIAILQC